MDAIRLYLDEDVFPLLAKVLRDRGFDVVSAHDLRRLSLSDADHLDFSIREGRAILAFNVKHFIQLAQERWNTGCTFPGVIVSTQVSFKELLRRTLRLLQSRTPESIRDRVVWLSDYA